MLEGFRFTHRAKLIWSTMLLDFWATFFSSAHTMLPIVANQLLGVGAAGWRCQGQGNPRLFVY